MRSHEERVAETKRRIAARQREKRLRRNTITIASAVAACLALLIGASLAMPGIAASIQTGNYSGLETAASIFHGGAALGYIVIGLLAFLLGVCVTVCWRAAFRHRLPQKPPSDLLSAAVLLRLLCPWRALLDVVFAAIRYHAPGLLCLGVRLGGQRNFPTHFAGHAGRNR